MAVVAISDSILTDIADAIRDKLDTEDTYKPSEMANAIESISGGGITPTGTKQISITQNGTTTEDVTNYASAEISVNVPTGTARSSSDLTSSNLTVTAPAGLYSSDASKTLTDANLTAGNIKKDVTIFGTTGTYEGSSGVSWDDICTGNQPSGEIVLTATSGVRGAFMNRYGTKEFSIRANNMLSIPQDFGRGSAYLTAVYFPNATSFTQIQNFMSCTRLKIADVGKVSSIGGQTFASSGINTLILRKSNGVTTLSNVNVFTSTPFASGGAGGTIYIPKVMYDHLGDGTSMDYQNASNWSTIHGYGTITWAKIEGSQYEI